MIRRVELIRKTGKLGEDLALNYFLRLNYRLIARNFHGPGGEIDLIFRKNDILVFVEVKTRRNENFGLPEDAFTHSKEKKILRTIETFREKKPEFGNLFWRLDLMGIHLDFPARKASMHHFQNILQFDR